MKASALTKMYLWRRRCIYEGVSADEDVFMKAKMYLWRCQRWRRCIYEGEDLFMKVSALTKMYSWRRRCIHEGVSADEDVFMKAKMYSLRCQRWRRCIYEGEDVFMKASALTKMYLWRRRCIYEGVSADEDVFMKAKMYILATAQIRLRPSAVSRFDDGAARFGAHVPLYQCQIRLRPMAESRSNSIRAIYTCKQKVAQNWFERTSQFCPYSHSFTINKCAGILHIYNLKVKKLFWIHTFSKYGLIIWFIKYFSNIV